MAERKWSNLVGNVTLQFTTDGINTTIATAKNLSDVIALLNHDVASISKNAKLEQLAEDLDLAQASAEFAFGSFDKFNQSLIETSGNISQSFKQNSAHLKNAEEEIGKVLAAVRLAAKEGREDLFQYFTPEQLENLTKFHGKFEEYYELLKKSDELQKDYEDKQEKFKKSLIGLANDTLDKVAKSVRHVFGELMPKDLGDAQGTINAFTSSFDKMFQLFKKAGNLATKHGDGIIGQFLGLKKSKKDMAESEGKVGGFSKTLSMFEKGFGGASKGVSTLGKATNSLGSMATRTGGIMSKLGPALLGALANPAVLAAVVAIGIAIAVAVVIFGTLMIAVKLAIEGWKNLIKIQEEFRTSSFRSMGSIDELTTSTNNLGASTRLGIDAAMKSLKAMNEVGLSGYSLGKGFVDLEGKIVSGQEAMEAMGDSIMKFSFISGIGEKDTAQFVKSMTELGEGVEGINQAFESMLQIQQVVGLSQAGLTKAMNMLVKQQVMLQTAFRGTEPQKFAAGLTMAYAAAEQAGVGFEVVDGIISRINEGMNSSVILMASFAGRVDELMNSTDMGTQLDIQVEGILKAGEKIMGLGPQMQLVMAKAFGTSMLEIAFAREKANLELNEQMQDALKGPEAIAKRFDEASNTITQIIKQIFTPLAALASEAMEPLMGQMKDLGTIVRDNINPLWEAMKGLISDIFGDLSMDSMNLESIVKNIIKALTEVVSWVRVIVDWAKSAWTMFKAVVDVAWALREAVIAIVETFTAPLGWVYTLYKELMGIDETSDNVTKRHIRRQQDVTSALEVEIDKRKSLEEETTDELETSPWQGVRGMPSYSQDNQDWWSEHRGYGLEEAYSDMGMLGSVIGTSSEIPSVKYTEDMKNNNDLNQIATLIIETRTTNASLQRLEEKEDPSTKEIADATKEMLNQPQARQSYRRGSTMGSRSNRWNA